MTCNSCLMYTGKYPVPGGIIINLDGGWTINHFGGPETYLGWLVLQPRTHIMEFTELSEEHLQTLGPNIQRTEIYLKTYWQHTFPEDPIQRVYVIYFFEYTSEADPPNDFHLHIHLIPRTLRLFQLLRQGSTTVAWRIRKVSCDPKFPLEYRKDHNNVQKLMEYLQTSLSSVR